mmetsp:Transcript_6561/g.9652  ORF Transcript_6561/g.9652 Transcript_6561/m.9652 type:complete len:104 (-) Transcript_6561:93-404(-)
MKRMSLAINVLIPMLTSSALLTMAQEQVSHGSLDQRVNRLVLSVSVLSNDGKQVVKAKLKLFVCVCKKIDEQVDVLELESPDRCRCVHLYIITHTDTEASQWR